LEKGKDFGMSRAPFPTINPRKIVLQGEVFHVRLRDVDKHRPLQRLCCWGGKILRFAQNDSEFSASPLQGEANDSTIPWLPLRRELAKP